MIFVLSWCDLHDSQKHNTSKLNIKNVKTNPEKYINNINCNIEVKELK